ncbi:MAG TPA: ImmA/IrrE family metallo-endopeptidase [Candidatus Ozemobacteraceae bacterium]|nr:ImmA/IrrE family metallo-endopeptidase [Candidatus Ozemobacteraceae bacterium]
MRSGIIRLLADLRQPGACELLAMLEKQIGWRVRQYFFEVVGAFRDDHLLTSYQREYFRTTLTDKECIDALHGGGRRWDESRSTIDELFQCGKAYRSSKAFQEMITFSAQFRNYAPYNNMLVKLQNPSCSFYATRDDWERRFNRRVNEEARAMLILAPMHPVMLVYDLDSTTGPALPEKLLDFTRVDGRFDQKLLPRLLDNCLRDSIVVEFVELSSTFGGYATTRCRGTGAKMRVAIHDKLQPASRFSVLCHELAHIYLGHLGSDEDNFWPTRINLTHAAIEVEAEATAYIVCVRLGLKPCSEAYICSYIENDSIPAGVSIELITKVAGKLEEMATRRLPARKEKPPKKAR